MRLWSRKLCAVRRGRRSVVLAIPIGTEIRSAEDTVMMPRTSVDPTTIALRTAIGLGLLDVRTAATAVNVIVMIVTAGSIDAVAMTVTEGTRTLDLAETTEIVTVTVTVTVTVAAATIGREEILMPVVETAMTGVSVIKTRTELDLRVVLLDDTLHLHAQQKIAVTAVVTKIAAAITLDEITPTVFAHLAETAAHHLLALRPTNPTPKNRKKSAAASWPRCNPTPAILSQIAASALQRSPQRRNSRQRQTISNAQTAVSSCLRSTSVRRRIPWMSVSSAAAVDFPEWRIEVYAFAFFMYRLHFLAVIP
jgi:hypothetical protein